jgi:hypothetical protein
VREVLQGPAVFTAGQIGEFTNREQDGQHEKDGGRNDDELADRRGRRMVDPFDELEGAV